MEVYLAELQFFPFAREWEVSHVQALTAQLENWGWATPINHSLVGTNILQLMPQFPEWVKKQANLTHSVFIQLGYQWYYRLLAQRIRMMQKSSQGQETAIAHDFLSLELHNFHHALYLSMGTDEQTFSSILSTLFYHYFRPGDHDLAIKLCQYILTRHNQAKRASLRATRLQLGLVHFYLGLAYRERRMLKKSEQSFHAASVLNEQPELSPATLSLATEKAKLAIFKLDFAAAYDLVKKAPEIPLSHDNESVLADMFALLGLIKERMGAYEEAETYLNKAIGIFRSMETLPSNSTLALNELGSFYLNQRRYIEAESVFREALTLNLRHKERAFTLGMSRVNLGLSLTALKRFSEAGTQFHQAISLLHTHPQVQGEVYHNLSNLALQKGEHEEAEAYAKKALSLYKDERKQADIYYNLGVISREMEPPKLHEAISYLERTLTVYQKHSLTLGLEAVLEELCHCHALLEQWEEAIGYAIQALEYAQSPRHTLGGYTEIAQLYALQEEWELATYWLKKARAYASQAKQNLGLQPLFIQILTRLQNRFPPLLQISVED